LLSVNDLDIRQSHVISTVTMANEEYSSVLIGHFFHNFVDNTVACVVRNQDFLLVLVEVFVWNVDFPVISVDDHHMLILFTIDPHCVI
jgi:hypothetical protein